MPRTKTCVGLALCAAAMLSSTPSADAADKGYRLVRPGTCSAVREQLVDRIVEQLMVRPRSGRILGRRWQRRQSTMDRSREGAAAPAARKSRRAPAGPGHYTTTNNQVVGVDEADRVKTDGRYIYTVHGDEVLIIKSWPATASSIVARYKVGAGARPQQLFIKGDKLVVFSRATSRKPARYTKNQRRRLPGRSYAATRMSILELGDRAAPRLLAHVDLEGALLRARMIGSDIYTVTNSALQLPQSFWRQVRKAQPRRQYRGRRYLPQVLDLFQRAGLRRQVRNALAKVQLTRVLPSVRFSYAAGQAPTERALVRCGDIYIPARQKGLGLVTLSHLNLAGGRVNASAVMGGGMHVYASQQALYVAANNWSWADGRQGTQIHKFALNSRQGPPRYAASGVVPGYLLNSFSMDEHRGHLRVATTDRGWRRTWTWRGRRVNAPASNVFVLRQRQRELGVVGSVRGLAPGERIYAARMLGDQGYVVTFRRTDPLYTLDLSNPKEPRVMGELKIPGFSSYIHLIAPGQLLTVGQDADQRGRVRGVHLQIFDVTDLKKPRRTHHHKLTLGFGSSRSLAQWDHHAFTYNSRTRTLALPLTVHRYHKNGGHFTGLVLVKADHKKGFARLGEVEHRDLAARVACARSSYCGGSRARYWHTPITRSVFIDNNLFTFSNHGVKATRLSDMNTMASLTFARINTAYLR